MADAKADDQQARAFSNSTQEKDTGRPVEVIKEGRRPGILARMVRHIPTLAVMALLGGLGAYGHHSGWKLPKFSTLTGNGTAVREDWCEEHGVPESQCFLCNPKLEAKFAADYEAKYGKKPPKRAQN
jgi:hypothetical protein